MLSRCDMAAWTKFSEEFDNDDWWKKWHQDHGHGPLTSAPENCKQRGQRPSSDNGIDTRRLEITQQAGNHSGAGFAYNVGQAGDGLRLDCVMSVDFEYQLSISAPPFDPLPGPDDPRYKACKGKLPGPAGTYTVVGKETRRSGWGN